MTTSWKDQRPEKAGVVSRPGDPGSEIADRGLTSRMDVVIAFRDGRRFLPDLLPLLRQQDQAIDNIVFVDDGSTDASGTYLRERCPEWTLVGTKDNRGPAAARNLGAATSDADWLLFLDVDDRPLPSWYSGFVSTPDLQAKIVRRGVTIVNGAVRRPSLPEAGLSGCIMVGSWAVAKSLWKVLGGYDERYRYSENFELSLRMRRHLEMRAGSSSPNEELRSGTGLEVIQSEVPRARNARHAGVRRRSALRLLAEHTANLTVQQRHDLSRVIFSTDLRTKRFDRLPVDALRLLRHR